MTAGERTHKTNLTMEHDPTSTKTRIRDRERTKMKILDAVGQIIRHEGIEKVRVRCVAKKACVNAVLIYRYFENRGNLVKQYYKSQEQAVPTETNVTTHTTRNAHSQLSGPIIDFLQEIRMDAGIRDLLKGEMISRQNISSEARTERLLQLMKETGKLSRCPDAEALAVFLSSAIYGLTLAESHPKGILGIDLGDATTWNRLETVLEAIANMVADKPF